MSDSISSTEAPVKGPFSHAMVNESIAREQGDLARFASRPGEVLHAGDGKRNFRLLSLSESSNSPSWVSCD
jgi:hypothetical protein